ncbi:hypothetical protein SAY87_019874 [Trapa incisa]|uniref:Uncharacterized protein n=1 Tax=Trapa incisa TaxID=236973 RepID=A0AAN7K6G7_9MYRT|nr:hypothetical protein SAY87_019874 [Trapa incisa]
MKKTAASSAAPIPRGASNYDELSMQQSLQFADCLKDLKNLKQQLYTAAEHFESSYQKHEQKQIVMSSLKDYALKALVNTVDHLGSMSYKVNSLLDQKSNQLSTMELPFSCFEQRIQACQKFISHGGLSQQSFFIKTPNYHTSHVFPDPQEITGKHPTTSVRRGQHQHPAAYAPGPSVADEAFLFAETPIDHTSPGLSDKRSASPFRFQLSRWGSLVNKSTSPIRSNSNSRKRFPSESRRSASPSSRAERDSTHDLELYASKNRRMFKALLGMRKSRNGVASHKNLDEN